MHCAKCFAYIILHNPYESPLSSLLFSHSVLSNSLQLCGLHNIRLPCPSPSPGANACPLSQWCHPTILSSVLPFSSCIQPFPSSESSPMRWLFILDGQSTGASPSASLSVNIQGWFPLGLTGLISLLSKGLASLLQYHNSKTSILQDSAFFMNQHSHPYMTTGKTRALTRQIFVVKVMSLLFNMLSRFVMLFFQGPSIF